jgi:hypothetical protein
MTRPDDDDYRPTIADVDRVLSAAETEDRT